MAHPRLVLEIGKIYEVSIGDCCISGSFTSKVTVFEPSEGSDGVYGTLKFENGIELETWWGCNFEEVKGD